MKRALLICCVILGSCGTAQSASPIDTLPGPVSEFAKCMVDVLRAIPNVQSAIVGRFGNKMFYLDYEFLDASGERQWNRLPVESNEDGSWMYWINDLMDTESDPGKEAGDDWFRKCRVDGGAILGPVLRWPPGEQPWFR